MINTTLRGNNAALIHLFRKVTQKSTPYRRHTWRHTITDVLTHIRENMQSDMTGCNHTVADRQAGTHTHVYIYIYIKFSILSLGATKTNTFLEMSKGN